MGLFRDKPSSCTNLHLLGPWTACRLVGGRLARVPKHLWRSYMDRKKVLLVEDSIVPQIATKTILEQCNCVVDIAPSGEEGIALNQKQNYDIVFMDIGLPGMDGLATARMIRSQEKSSKKVPIIALTAQNEVDLKDNARLSGINDYLIKPLKPKAIQELLSRYCK